MSDVFVLGRDAHGTVAESREMDPPFRYYLTDCCGASSKGLEDYVGCRACYQEVDPVLGDVPDMTLTFHPEREGADRFEFAPRPGWRLVEVYGDGIPYDEWKAVHLPQGTVQ